MADRVAGDVQAAGGGSLEAARELLDLQISEMPVAVILWSRDFTVESWNPAAERIFGYSAAEAIGRSGIGLITPDVLDPEILAAWLRLAEVPVSVTIRNENVTRDGRAIICEWINRPILDPDGVIRRVLSIAQDITARIRAEADTALLAAIVESSHDAIVGSDSRGRVNAWNRGAERLLGYSAEEAIGLQVSTLVIPGEADLQQRVLREVGLEGATLELEIHPKRKDGSVFVASIVLSPIRDASDGIIGIAAIVRDTTAARQAEAAVARLAAIVQSSRDAIISTDLAGLITSWNPGAERLSGYAAAEMIGQPLAGIADPPERQALANRIRNTADTGKAEAYETARHRKDGTTVNLSVAISPIRDRAGQVVGVSTIARDVTERRAAEGRARRATQALKALGGTNDPLIRSTDRQELFQAVCQVVVELGGYAVARIDTPDAAGGLRLSARAGAPSPQTGDDEDSADPQGLTVLAFRQKTVQVRRGGGGPEAGSIIALPLRQNGDLYGVLTLWAAEADAFEADEADLLAQLATDLAFGIDALDTRNDRETAVRDLEHAMESTVQVVASTVETRDPYTAGHQRRVAEIADRIAEQLALPEGLRQGLRLAAVLHDVGKIGIPAEILSKPTRLTASEMALVREHAQIGYEILKAVPFPWPLADIVHQHHERWNGSGYPQGLAGADTLIEARILAVADVIESMTSHRPYRPALGLAAALEEIAGGRGTLYDPAVADAAVEAMRRDAEPGRAGRAGDDADADGRP